MTTSLAPRTPWEVSYGPDDLNGTPAHAHAANYQSVSNGDSSPASTSSEDETNDPWPGETVHQACQTLSLDLSTRNKGMSFLPTPFPTPSPQIG